MKTKAVLFIFLSIMVMSCGGRKQLPTATTSHRVIDSVYTQVRYIPKDTTVFIPADSISIKALISQLDVAPVTKTEGIKTITLYKKGDTIQADCNTEAYEKIIQYQAQQIETFKTHFESLDTKIVQVEKYIPKFVKFLMWLGIVFIIFIIVGSILIIKSFIK